MKNIHILPTDKPSRLCRDGYGKLYLTDLMESKVSFFKNQNIYITSDEEIKDGDWFLHTSYGSTSIQKALGVSNHILDNQGMISNKENNLKIILTTDIDLINDGVQAIDDEFLEWFVNNPSCESIEVQTKITKDGVWTDLKGYVELPTIHSIKYKIIIPKEEPKQENCCTPVGQIKRYLNCVGCDRKPKQETLEHTSKFIAFTLQDSESWIQHSIPLDSFEKADNFCQQFRDRKMSYLICKTLKQGYNGK